MTAPELSVVVPSVNGWDDLRSALSALDAERTAVPLEVLVPERCGDEVRKLVAATFPWARVLPVRADTTIPRMRALAFHEARADAIAVIEDHVLVPPGWCRQLLDTRARGEDVVGGSVVNAAVDRTVDWAAFLCEYSHLLPPLQAGPVASLTGNNTLYAKRVIQQHWAAVDAGQWEDYLHDAMRAAGVKLVCHPEIAVAHKKHFTIAEYSSQRFLYARSYAGERTRSLSRSLRIARFFGSFALPPLLFGRIVSRVLSKRVHRAELARSLPLIAWFVCAWAAGEIVGIACGPGSALAKVR